MDGVVQSAIWHYIRAQGAVGFIKGDPTVRPNLSYSIRTGLSSSCNSKKVTSESSIAGVYSLFNDLIKANRIVTGVCINSNSDWCCCNLTKRLSLGKQSYSSDHTWFRKLYVNPRFFFWISWASCSCDIVVY
jgi:hypothetical protein